MTERRDGPAVVLEMRDVTRRYGALRPLRIASLSVAAGEHVSLGGLDAAAAEVFINLVTGASLPDAGVVRVFGEETREIPDGDAWLTRLERFGIVSARAVLLDGSTLLQNLALPFTLELDPIPAPVADRARALAARCGIAPELLEHRAGDLAADARVRARLARALALDPALVLIEDPTADVEPDCRDLLARDMAAACSAPGLSVLVVTNDEAFGRQVAVRSLLLHASTGAVRPRGKRWFGRS